MEISPLRAFLLIREVKFKSPFNYPKGGFYFKMTLISPSI